MYPSSKSFESAISRRKFLGTALAGTAASLAGAASMDFLSAEPALAQSNLTPDEALKALLDGNERFASGRLTSFDEDLKILRDHTVEKQEPFAAVLSCADSRVPVEIIFDQTIGHIFVTRVAGNVVTPEIIGSLEYGAAVLGTKVILVLGHASCGAVKAAIQAKAVPGQISALFPHLQPAVRPGRLGPRRRHKGERIHPGRTPGEGLARAGPDGEGRQAKDRRGILRPRHWQSDPGLTRQR